MLPRTVQMNHDLEDVMRDLNDLVADPSTLTSLTRLGDTFNLVQDAGQKIVPAQTVCNYWNYCVTYLTSHFELPTPFGFAERVLPPAIAGTTAPNTLPRNPMDNYSGGQADGRFASSALVPSAQQGVFTPLNSDPTAHDGIPILHGNPYGPARHRRPAELPGRPDRLRARRGPAPGPGRRATRRSASARSPSEARAPASHHSARPTSSSTQNGDRVFWDSANDPPENP